MTLAHAAPTRRAVGIAIGEFTSQPDGSDTPRRFQSLPFATQRVAAVAEALRRYDYECRVPHESAKLTGETVADTIWGAAEGLGLRDFLVVHIVSHGFVAKSGALYVVGADGRHHHLSQVDHWLMRVADFPAGPHTLFLLDLCHAGAPVRQSWQLNLADRETRAWAIAACRPSEVAFNGRFSEAVANVLVRLADSGVDIDPTRSHLPLATVARAVRQEVKRLADEQDALSQEVTATLLDLASEPVDLAFFPNSQYLPRSRRGARPRVDSAVAPFLDDVDDGLDPVHFMERAAGHSDYQRRHEQGCFSGRKRELKILSAWFDNQDDVRVRVVTGSPGVGKSALVGLLVCAGHPVLREPTRAIWENVERAPFVNPRLAAVHARQRTAAELMASLGRQLHLTVPDEESWEVDDFLRQIAERAEQPVIVVDALDEAEQHRQVMREILLPLATLDRPDGRPVCRLLVAMRPWKELQPLQTAAEDVGGLIDLNEVPRNDLRWDIEEYVNGLVRVQPPYDQAKYSGARGAFAFAVAETLTQPRPGEKDDDREWGAFLVAGLYARHLTTAHEPISDTEKALELGGRVPLTLPDLLNLDLATRSRVTWLKPVLTALAHARGDGMSAYTVRQAARAFAMAGTGEPSDRHVAEALQAARFYLRRSAEADGTTLYRLFHQGLADHLRGPEQSPPAAAELLVRALLAPLETPGTPDRRWDLAEPYLLRQAAHHVIEAKCVSLLAGDIEFLVHAEPGGVCDVLDASGGLWWLDARSYTRVLHSTDGSVTSRRYALALYALRHENKDAAERLANPPGQAPLIWQPEWLASSSRVRSAEQAPFALDSAPAALAVIREHGSPYAALVTASGQVSAWRLDNPRRLWSSRDLPTSAAVPGPRERLLIGLGSSDAWYSLAGAVGSVADLPSDQVDRAHRVSEIGPVPSDTFGPNQLCQVRTELGDLVLVGHPDGDIRLYLYSDEVLRPAGIIATASPVTALDAVATTAAVVVAAVVDHDLEVFRWRLRTRRLSDRRSFGPAGDARLVRAVLCGRDIFAVTAGSEALAWQWRGTAPMGSSKPTGSDSVCAMALADNQQFVAVGTTNGTVATYALADGSTQAGPIQVHSAAVSSLGFRTVAGRLALVVGSADGAVACMDPTTGRLSGWATAHDGEVLAADVAELSRRTFLITNGKDGMRVTDPSTGQSSPLWRYGGPATTPEPLSFVAHGRRLTTEVDHRGVVHVHDVEGKRRIARMDFGSPVLEVAATARGDLMLRLSNDAVFLRWNT